MKKFILASASPRRQKLLSDLKVDFEIKVADVDETLRESTPPFLAVQQLAIKKALAVLKNGMKGYIIGADTVVVFKDKILGKPADEEEASKMLSMLSGNTHEVLTGVCVVRCSDGYVASFCEKTKVTFRNLQSEQIKAYIDTKIPMDKAGAYGIQEDTFSFVSEISGDYDNVVGLPIAPLKNFLLEEFNVEL